MPLLVRSLKAFINSSMTSTLKEQRKSWLVQARKSVDNYVDTSRNSRSYPQAAEKLVLAQVNFALAAKLRADQIRGGEH